MAEVAISCSTQNSLSEYVSLYTVEPLNKGHLGTQAAVPYSEVVPYWEVRDKTVILCTFTASMMYKTLNDPECIET